MRIQTDREGRRSYSVSDTPSHSFSYRPSRRNTIAVISNEQATAPPPSAHSTYQARVESAVPFANRRASLDTGSSSRKGGTMSKVVRTVKNVTKGYSNVQIKVRNGELAIVY